MAAISSFFKLHQNRNYNEYNQTRNGTVCCVVESGIWFRFRFVYTLPLFRKNQDGSFSTWQYVPVHLFWEESPRKYLEVIVSIINSCTPDWFIHWFWGCHINLYGTCHTVSCTRSSHIYYYANLNYQLIIYFYKLIVYQ